MSKTENYSLYLISILQCQFDSFCLLNQYTYWKINWNQFRNKHQQYKRRWYRKIVHFNFELTAIRNAILPDVPHPLRTITPSGFCKWTLIIYFIAQLIAKVIFWPRCAFNTLHIFYISSRLKTNVANYVKCFSKVSCVLFHC